MAKTETKSNQSTVSALEYLGTLDGNTLENLRGIALAKQAGNAIKAVRSFQNASSILGPIAKAQGKVGNLSFSGKEIVKVTSVSKHGLSKEGLSAARKERSKLAAWKLLTGAEVFIPEID